MASEVNLRLSHLRTAAHLLLPVSPHLSRHAVSAMARTAATEQVRIADAVARGYCRRCGTIFVPAETCSVSVKTMKRKRGEEAERPVEFHDPPSGSSGQTKPRTNSVEYRCRICGTLTVLPGTSRKALRGLQRGTVGATPLEPGVPERQSTPKPTATPRLATPSPSPAPGSATPGSASSSISVSKAKKQRGKIQELKGLLAKQKEKKEATGSARLEDFLAELR